MSVKFKNFKKSSRTLMAALLGKNNIITTADGFTVNKLTVLTGAFNTKLELFIDQTPVELEYNRLSLTELFKDVLRTVPTDTYATTLNVLDIVNLKFGTLLGADDIINEPAVLVNNKYTLRAAPGSLIWLDQVQIGLDSVVVPPLPETGGVAATLLTTVETSVAAASFVELVTTKDIVASLLLLAVECTTDKPLQLYDIEVSVGGVKIYEAAGIMGNHKDSFSFFSIGAGIVKFKLTNHGAAAALLKPTMWFSELVLA